MNIIERLTAQFLGKRIDAQLDKWKISKTKVIALLAVLIPIIPKVGEAVGYTIVIPKEVYEVLAGLGLWFLRDSVPPAIAVQSETKQNEIK